MSLAKHFPFWERANLELRLDAFSVFNHPTFGNPGGPIMISPRHQQSCNQRKTYNHSVISGLCSGHA